jgi:hypothetical protein
LAKLTNESDNYRMSVSKSKQSRYSVLIERIFRMKYTQGATEVSFERTDIEQVAQELGIKLPKNLGDVIYSFRYRAQLPAAIREKAATEKAWIIRPAGRSKYVFAQVPDLPIEPQKLMSEIKIPEATPGLVLKYSFRDEQALLAKIRYNRLIDIFTGVTCYSLQNHLRTTVPGLGQVETDEIYIGVDKTGSHYVFPVQAKGGTDKLNIVQIEQDFALCAAKFPDLRCRVIGAIFMANNVIALFLFEMSEQTPKILLEKHYRLVLSQEITREDLERYNSSRNE